MAAFLLASISAVVAFPTGVGAFEPNEVVVGETSRAHPCGISRDGNTVVFRGESGDGWERWTPGSGADPIGGAVSSTSDVQVSDDGRYLTQRYWDSTIARITQFDAATGITLELSGLHKIVSRPAVSPSGAQVTWAERRAQEVGAPTFVGVRQWNRATGQVTTLLDVTNDDWISAGSVVPSSNGRFLSIGWSPRPERFTAVQVIDTINRSRFTAQRPEGLQFARLLGISDAGNRFLWLDGTDFTDDRWIVADRTGAIESEINLGHTMSFDGQALRMEGEYHFAPDGSEVLAIGARPAQSQPRGEGIAYRWRIGGELETIETSLVVSGIAQNSPSPRLSSSWCGVSADLRFVAVVDPTATPAMSISRADLDSVAPRRITSREVTGPQLSDQVTRLYEAFFDRSPDNEGLDFWMRQRAAGVSLASVAEQFALGDEFNQTYGPLDDDAFVRRIYTNVLDRSPEEEGLAFWVARLRSGTTRGALMIGFSESPENIEQTGTTAPVFDPRVASISRLYRAFFGRTGDDEGLTFWFDEISSGRASLSRISSGFVLSAEFTADYGDLDDSRFVDLVYENVLGRSPDAGGRSFWLSQLAAGRSRGDMMIGFSESPEFIVSTDTVPASG